MLSPVLVVYTASKMLPDNKNTILHEHFMLYKTNNKPEDFSPSFLKFPLHYTA